MASFFEIVTFLLVIFISFFLINASDRTKDENPDKDSISDRAGVWFGPRLGKRSLQLNTDEKSQIFHRLLEAADTLKYYYDQLPYEMQIDDPEPKIPKKVIFTPKLGRNIGEYQEKRTFENVEFIPRLGRRKLDNLLTRAEEISEPIVRGSRGHFFSPRLGRSYYSFSPRLGREVPDYVYGEPETRVVRSANITK